MEIYNYNARRAMEWAYDNFPKQEFLSRLESYINSSIDLARQEQRLQDNVTSLGNKINEVKCSANEGDKHK